MNNTELKKQIYVIMENNFLKENGRNIDDNNDDLFPANWYLSKNYNLKSEILLEAIKTKKPIIKTKKYQLLLENSIGDLNE